MGSRTGLNVLEKEEFLPSSGIRSPNHPAHSPQSLCPYIAHAFSFSNFPSVTSATQHIYHFTNYSTEFGITARKQIQKLGDAKGFYKQGQSQYRVRSLKFWLQCGAPVGDSWQLHSRALVLIADSSIENVRQF